MPSLKNQIRLTLLMAAFLLAALVPGHLAPADIRHGERERPLGWSAVRVLKSLE